MARTRVGSRRAAIRAGWHATRGSPRRSKHAGPLYACYETEDELDRRRKRQRARGLPPIYDRAGLKLDEAERRRLEAEGRRPHWRFRLPNTEDRTALQPLPTLVSWNDLVRGDQTVDLGSLSDPVLIRADGSFLYTFTSVVDDIDFAITHIIRGEDHVTNAGVQLALFEALGAAPPVYAHHSLLVGKDGEPLSKRLGALSIASLRDAGLEPMAIASHAALVGTSENVAAYQSLDALAGLFDLGKISRAPARFDPGELTAVNAALLHQMPYEMTVRAAGGGRHRRRRDVLGRSAGQPGAVRRRGDVVGGGRGCGDAGDRGRCAVCRSGGAVAGGALGRGDVADMDESRVVGDGRQGAGALSSAAIGADGA